MRSLWARAPLPVLPRGPHLCLGEAERRGQLHSLRRGKVPLDLEALLQAGQLRVGEDGPGLPPPAVFPRQLRVMLEERRHLHPFGPMEGREKHGPQ